MSAALVDGARAWAEGDFEAAERAFAAAAEEAPSERAPWTGLGLAQWRLGRPADALESFRQAVRAAPDHGPAWANLGLALRDLGRQREAVEVFRVATRLAPDYAQGFNEWANVLVDAGLFEAARALYRRALEVERDKAVTHHNLGVCLRLLGSREEARASFEHALALDPSYKHSLEELGRLRLEDGDRAAGEALLDRAGTSRAEALKRVVAGETAEGRPTTYADLLSARPPEELIPGARIRLPDGTDFTMPEAPR